jgi:hypothetical protein
MEWSSCEKKDIIDHHHVSTMHPLFRNNAEVRRDFTGATVNTVLLLCLPQPRSFQFHAGLIFAVFGMEWSFDR